MPDPRARGADKWLTVGSFIRAQRQLANLSLRQLSALAHVSNPYLSQIERGLHEPSVRILQAIADALDVTVEVFLEQAGLIDRSAAPLADDEPTETAIRRDPHLSTEQKNDLLAIYQSHRARNPPHTAS